MNQVEALIVEIDRAWRLVVPGKTELKIIGAGALEAMVDRGLVAHEALIACFNDAVDVFLGDAREDDLPKYVANLHRVERDTYGLEPTEIDLPSRLTE